VADERLVVVLVESFMASVGCGVKEREETKIAKERDSRSRWLLCR
jgi:hypothetical protein